MQLVTVIAWGQFSLKGTVKSGNEPLTGASVVIAGTFYGQSANASGHFEFKNLEQGSYTLKVSFIGYIEKNVSVELNKNTEVHISLSPSVIYTDEVLVEATRAKEKTPVAYTNISGDKIANQNMGQDIPYLLSLTPSFVATSDAGAGVGYTNFRIRGTDLNRINVTVNGIPYNDAESHSTYFVDVPDLASSLENIQVQRGVGTSSNGAAAFGATINLQTNTVKNDSYAEFKTAGGSFNTLKNTVAVGSGLINNKISFNARLSKVTSDGYIDRASSDLKSFFVSAGYHTENTVIKANIFSGFEETYQAWNGISPEILETNRKYNSAGEYTDANGNTKYYENQVDHYQQDHYQLHFSHRFNPSLYLNAAIHYTYGSGYYENYKEDEEFADYQLPNPVVGDETIESTDLVNRKWLDNDFYGIVYSLSYKKNKSDFTFGGGWNTYDGRHFGNIIWARYLGNAEFNHEWYRGTGLKKDLNIYAKYNYQVNKILNLFTDLQFRHINYKITGIDDDLRDIGQEHYFNFFNPKFGIFLKPSSNQNIYVSYARGNREPNRSNYVDAAPGTAPVHETLNDFEAGYNICSSKFSVGANLYYMRYKNQLILTGEINDVGDPIMVNVKNSYRLGLELMIGLKLHRNLQWDVNATFSKNEILDFIEYVDNWDTWVQESFDIGKTNIAFSPTTIANSNIVWSPVKNFNINFISSYVSKQFIDNTSSDERSLDAWFVNNLKFDYSFGTQIFEKIKLHLMVNNVFNHEYESNAWVYSYISGGERLNMAGLYPQAGRYFMVGADFKF